MTGMTEFPALNRILLFLSIFNAGGIMAVGAWYVVKQTFGDIDNPEGMIVRFGLMGAFAGLVWFFIRRTRKRRQ